MDRTIPRSHSQNLPSSPPCIILKSLKDGSTYEHFAGLNNIISLGSGEKDNFKVCGKGIVPQHCFIKYSEEEVWTIYENSNDKESAGTFIYLRSIQEMREKVEESRPHKLCKNMIFFCGFSGFQII